MGACQSSWGPEEVVSPYLGLLMLQTREASLVQRLTLGLDGWGLQDTGALTRAPAGSGKSRAQKDKTPPGH